MYISEQLRRFALKKLGYRKVNQLLTLKYRNRHANLSEEHKTPIIVSGSQRSGTTFLAECLSRATQARLMFEPLATSGTYSRTRQLVRRTQKLPFSSELHESLTWLMKGDLPYNHKVDAITPPIHYQRRLIKDLSLGFALPEIAAAFPVIPIFHIVRHPLDSIRSHLKLKIRLDHLTVAQRNITRCLQQTDILDQYPWLSKIDINFQNAAELELIAWCIDNGRLIEPLQCSNALVVKYEDIAGKEIPDSIWDILEEHGVKFDRTKTDISRFSQTTNSSETEGMRQGKMVGKYLDMFEADEITHLRGILLAAGLMAEGVRSVFGHDIV